MKNIGKKATWVIVGAAALIALSGIPSASANGLMAGVGQATFGGCPLFSDNIGVAAAEQTPGFWRIVMADENHVVSAGLGCAIVSATVFSGFFAPGGVVFPPQVLFGLQVGDVLFVGNPFVGGGATLLYPITLCTALAGCVGGWMELVVEYI